MYLLRIANSIKSSTLRLQLYTTPFKKTMGNSKKATKQEHSFMGSTSLRRLQQRGHLYQASEAEQTQGKHDPYLCKIDAATHPYTHTHTYMHTHMRTYILASLHTPTESE